MRALETGSCDLQARSIRDSAPRREVAVRVEGRPPGRMITATLAFDQSSPGRAGPLLHETLVEEDVLLLIRSWIARPGDAEVAAFDGPQPNGIDPRVARVMGDAVLELPVTVQRLAPDTRVAEAVRAPRRRRRSCRAGRELGYLGWSDGLIRADEVDPLLSREPLETDLTGRVIRDLPGPTWRTHDRGRLRSAGSRRRCTCRTSAATRPSHSRRGRSSSRVGPSSPIG